MSSISLNGDTSGAILLQAPAIAGSTTLTLPATTATLAINGPAFSAYMSGNQSISNGTNTKIVFDVEEFDTASCYNTSTYRFTPNVAGYYQATIKCFLNIGATGGIDLRVYLYKNGSSVKRSFTPYASPVAYYDCSLVSLVYLNGSTDYIEAYVSQGSGSSQNLGNGGAATDNWFQACLVRGA